MQQLKSISKVINCVNIITNITCNSSQVLKTGKLLGKRSFKKRTLLKYGHVFHWHATPCEYKYRFYKVPWTNLGIRKLSRRESLYISWVPEEDIINEDSLHWYLLNRQVSQDKPKLIAKRISETNSQWSLTTYAYFVFSNGAVQIDEWIFMNRD
jgi:hypothetical protein